MKQNILVDIESALTTTKVVKMVSFKKEDMCQPDPIAHDYDNMDDKKEKQLYNPMQTNLLKPIERELAMSNQRWNFAEKKLAASEADQKRLREIIRTFASKINDMLEDVVDQECEQIVCVVQLSERLTVANDDREKIIKQQDLFSEQLKVEKKKIELLKEENSELKKNFTDLEIKKIVEEKMEQLKDELTDLKSDENNRNLKRIRRERNDLKQENSRILHEQMRLISEFEDLKKKYGDCLRKSIEDKNSNIEEAEASAKKMTNQLVEGRDYYCQKYMELLVYNDKKELSKKQVKQQVTSNYPKTIESILENTRRLIYRDRMNQLQYEMCSTKSFP
uniref:Uncharacterized protein n=1 Tax=Panagrolaimus sp. JU765 TaxID=591449 RepID=A0AC34RQN8_9BILA